MTPIKDLHRVVINMSDGRSIYIINIWPSNFLKNRYRCERQEEFPAEFQRNQ